MEEANNNLIIIAHIHTPFSEKFGIPRQSGLVPSLRGEIHFEGTYRNPDAIRGIEEFSHLWLLWGFTESKRKPRSSQYTQETSAAVDSNLSGSAITSGKASGEATGEANNIDAGNKSHPSIPLTVRPPRLGGQERKGVFATRSPYRPNSIGLSCVELLAVEYEPDGSPILIVGGADLLDGTPIYDIKPYLPYADSHPNARGSFGEAHSADRIAVVFPEELLTRLPESLRESAIEVLAQDPRAAYQKKEGFVYGMKFYEYDIRFTVSEHILKVVDVINSSSTNSHIK